MSRSVQNAAENTRNVATSNEIAADDSKTVAGYNALVTEKFSLEKRVGNEPMEIVVSKPAEIATRTLEPRDRDIVNSWLLHLRNWENDSFVREHSELLAAEKSVYVLKTSNDIQIFFSLENDTITVLDLVRPAALQRIGVGVAEKTA